MLFPLLLALSTAQPADPPVAIRPVEGRAGERRVPLTETAEPLGLLVAGLDADRDGATARAEFAAGLGDSFAAADANGDGQHGYIEYAAWATRWLGSQNALPGPYQIDTDGDDRISRDEFLAEYARQFDRLDANRDGALSRAELLVVRHPRMEMPRPPQPPRRPFQDRR
jgi:hypothetical protein